MAVSLTTIEILRRLALDPIAMATNAKPRANDRDFDITFTLIISLSVLLALLVVALASPLANLLEVPRLVEVLPVVAIILVCMGLWRTHDAYLARNMNFRAIAIRQIASVSVGGSIGLVMAYNGFELWSLVAQQVSANIVSIITLWFGTRWRPRPAFSLAEIRENLNQSLHISAANVSSSVMQDADIYFVSGIFGPVVAGMYSAAKRMLLAAILIVTYAITSVSVSSLANIEDEDERIIAAVQGLTLATLIALPSFVGLSVVSQPLIEFLLDQRWEQSGAILEVLALSGIATTLHLYLGSILMVEQRAKANNLCSAVGAGTAMLMLWLFAHYGPREIAWAIVAGSFVTLPLRVELVRRVFRMDWLQLLEKLWPAAGAALLMWLMTTAQANLVINLPAWVKLLIEVPTAVILYVLGIKIFAPDQFQMVWEHGLTYMRRKPAATQ